jgi:hypothetical protein
MRPGVYYPRFGQAHRKKPLSSVTRPVPPIERQQIVLRDHCGRPIGGPISVARVKFAEERP